MTATGERTAAVGLRARGRAMARSAAARRRLGRIMIATAAVAVAIVVVSTVVVSQLIGTVNRTSGETLAVTVDALESMESTVDLADDLLASTADSLAALETTLTTVSGSFDAGSTTISDIGELTSTAEPTLRNAEDSLRSLEGLGGEIDAVLAGLGNLPFGGPGYDPAAGLGVTFGNLADDLAPLPDEFAATSDGLDDLATNLDQLQTDIDALTVTVSTLNGDLAGSRLLIDDYRDNISRARDLADGSRQDIGRETGLLRILLLVAAVNFALSQLVPLWVGWGLVSGASAFEDLDQDRDVELDRDLDTGD